MLLRTNHTVTLVGRALKQFQWSYGMQAYGLNTWALSEGGIEITALEDGQLLKDSSRRLWRGRVSTAEFDNRQEGPFSAWDAMGEIAFTMRPGHEYTFNVGVRAFSDRTPGAGVATV